MSYVCMSSGPAGGAYSAPSWINESLLLRNGYGKGREEGKEGMRVERVEGPSFYRS